MSGVKTRRRYLRVKPETGNPVNVSLIGVDFMDEFKVVDVSRDGVGIIAPNAFQGCNLHEQIELALSLPYPKRVLVKATGKIVHLQGSRFGIAFSKVSPKGEKFLHLYIAKRIEKENFVKRLAFYL
ncbi:MAG: PilZ domain-containing protein [Desulfosalsimonadaceae bacterium]